MSYPFKDRVKAEKIWGDYQKEIEDIATDKKTYEVEIEKLRKKPIPPALQSKLLDERFGKSHAFEDMKHSHTKRSRLDMVNCIRCQFNEREIEAENLIDGMNGNEQTVSQKQSGPTYDSPLRRLKIYRGKYDDVVGFVWSWG